MEFLFILLTVKYFVGMTGSLTISTSIFAFITSSWCCCVIRYGSRLR